MKQKSPVIKCSFCVLWTPLHECCGECNPAKHPLSIIFLIHRQFSFSACKNSSLDHLLRHLITNSRLSCWESSGRGKVFYLRKLPFICDGASASWTSRKLVKVRELEGFSPLPKLIVIGRPSFPLQLVINGDQALALCFHKVLLGQQSHQLGCLKFYHQRSSNKCWPERLLLFGNSCSLSL